MTKWTDLRPRSWSRSSIGMEVKFNELDSVQKSFEIFRLAWIRTHDPCHIVTASDHYIIE